MLVRADGFRATATPARGNPPDAFSPESQLPWSSFSLFMKTFLPSDLPVPQRLPALAATNFGSVCQDSNHERGLATPRGNYTSGSLTSFRMVRASIFFVSLVFALAGEAKAQTSVAAIVSHDNASATATSTLASGLSWNGGTRLYAGAVSLSVSACANYQMMGPE